MKDVIETRMKTATLMSEVVALKSKIDAGLLSGGVLFLHPYERDMRLQLHGQRAESMSLGISWFLICRTPQSMAKCPLSQVKEISIGDTAADDLCSKVIN